MRALNAKQLDISVRIPKNFFEFEDLCRKLIAKRIRRGRIDAFIQIESTDVRQKAPHISLELAQYYWSQLQEIHREIVHAEEPSLGHLLGVPHIYEMPEATIDSEAIRELVSSAMSEALGQVLQMRVLEGESLLRDFMDRLAALRNDLAVVASRREAVIEEYKAQKTEHHVPHRIREGYGMRDEVIEQAADRGIRVIISVDTGILVFAAGETARRRGIDLIVTDHHLPQANGVPKALAVVNPLMLYATNPQHRGVRVIVSWELLKEFGVPVDEGVKLAHPGVKLAQDALTKLKARFLAEKKSGTVAASARVKISELYAMVESEYQRLGRKSLDDLQARWKLHLKDYFGHVSASELTTDMLNAYAAARSKDKASNATINRELAVIRHGLTLGQQSTPPKVMAVPKFRKLPEAPPRTGFLTDEAYMKLSRECSDEGVWLRAAFATAASFAWRRNEVLSLKVSQLDFPGRLIRLNAGATKNGAARAVRMTNEAFDLLSACAAGKGPDEFVFTREGARDRVRDFRVAWKNACERAGVPDLLFHDLRRTGARNLRRLGVSEGVVMKIGGWRTRSVFDRYNIIDELDLAEAADKLDEKRAAQAALAAEATDSKTDNTGIGGSIDRTPVQ